MGYLKFIFRKIALHLYSLVSHISKAFDIVTHSQLFYSLYISGVNFSVILFLRYWYSNSFLSLKSSPATTIKVKWGVRQGGVLSPSLFKICIFGVLAKISATYLSDFSDVSYLAYANDLPPISKTRIRLSKMVSSVSDAFSRIGLSLNKEKCEFLSFTSTSSSPLNCDTLSIPSVDSLRWLGISLTNNLSSFRQRTVYDISII